MSQLLLVLGIIGLIFLYVLYKKNKKKVKEDRGEMVKCQTCGVNIPKSQALASGNNWFCSEEHVN